MEIRKARYTSGGKIDCEIKHEYLGWIPFTASGDDVEEQGRQIYARCLNGDAGEIVPYSVEADPVENRREKACKSLEAEMHEYIFVTRDYPLPTQSTLQAIFNDPDSNQEQRNACKAVFDWVKGTVLLYYYTKKTQILASDHPESVTWDFTVCNSGAPGYTLAQIIQMCNLTT